MHTCRMKKKIHSRIHQCVNSDYQRFAHLDEQNTLMYKITIYWEMPSGSSTPNPGVFDTERVNILWIFKIARNNKVIRGGFLSPACCWVKTFGRGNIVPFYVVTYSIM